MHGRVGSRLPQLLFLTWALSFIAGCQQLSVKERQALLNWPTSLPAADVSLYVADAESGRVLLQHQADVPRSPASVMKLITTAVALQQFGPQWQGELQLALHPDDAKAVTNWQPPQAEVALQHGLALRPVGFGTVSEAALLQVRRELTRRAVALPTEITVDTRWWPLSSADLLEAPFDNRPRSRYNLRPDGAAIELQTPMMALQVRYPHIYLQSEIAPALQVDSTEVNWQNGSCSIEQLQQLQWQWQGNTAHVTGTLGKRCRYSGDWQLMDTQTVWRFAIQQLFAANVEVRFEHNEGFMPWFSVKGPRLDARIAHTNKTSDNSEARQLFALIGASEPDSHVSLDASKAQVLDVLNRQRISTQHLVLENGSGLSRQERLTALTLGQLLQRQYHHEYAPEFIASLPIAGVDGTLKARFAKSSAVDCARLKTGSLNGVRSLAGYVFAKGQRPLVFVAIVNSAVASTAGVRYLNQAVLQLCQPSAAANSADSLG